MRKKLTTTKPAWAVKWRSDNSLDGRREFFIGAAYSPGEPVPGTTCLLFTSRARARKFIDERFGYIRLRPDLQSEPHGWKMPQAIRVNVTVAEAR